MKSSLPKINVNTLLMFTQYISLHPFIFNLNMSLYLKWVSHRLHIIRSCVFVCLSLDNSDYFCLLTDVFTPFTLKMIIDMMGLKSTILLAVFICFTCYLFLFTPFPAFSGFNSTFKNIFNSCLRVYNMHFLKISESTFKYTIIHIAQELYNSTFPILLSLSCAIVLIHFLFLHAINTQYIINIVALNSYF